ncbi:MAG: repeat-containing protein [Chitinophagaceae bacterium]|nr:repeat-containing protein [Chitinophagaceae bacterium]
MMKFCKIVFHVLLILVGLIPINNLRAQYISTYDKNGNVRSNADKIAEQKRNEAVIHNKPAVKPQPVNSPPQNEEITPATDNSDYNFTRESFDVYGLKAAQSKATLKWGFLNKNDQPVIPIIYDGVGAANLYTHDDTNGYYCVKLNGKFGLVNKKGKVVLPIVYDKEVLVNKKYKSTEWYASVFYDGHPSHDIILQDGLQNEMPDVVITYDHKYPYHEGLAMVKSNNKYGFVDANNIEVIPLIFDDGIGFINGLSEMKYKGKYGFINSFGNIIIPFIYDIENENDRMNNGIMRLILNKMYGFINSNGKLITPFIYEYADNFEDELSPVKKNGKWGAINLKGITIVPLIYDDVKNTGNGTLQARQKGKFISFDKNGKRKT